MSRATQTTLKNIEPIVRAAIAIYLGDISSLPRAVKNRIFEVYRAFFTACLNIEQVKGISENEVLDKITETDEQQESD